MNRRILRIVVSVLALSSLLSCAPKLVVPEPSDLGIEVPHRYEGSGGNAAEEHHREWWRDFHSPVLDKLVSRVLHGNFELKEGAARVKRMKALVEVAGAERFPALNLEGRGSKSKVVYGGIGVGDISSTIESYELSLVPSYEIDLWGRKGNSTRASLYEYLSSVEKENAAVQSVIADAVSLAVETAYLGRQIEILERRLEAGRSLVETLESRYRAGLVPLRAVVEARSSYESLVSQKPDLERSIDETRRKLSKLMGKYPSNALEGDVPLVDVESLPPIPVGLPSELLKRRPDVRAAELAMRSQFERVFVAWKNRFPRITLTGSFGYSSDQLKDLFTTGNDLWSLALGITAPLFEGGRLKGLQEAERSRFEEFVSLYAQTILQAFYEVEVGLSGEKELRKKREALLSMLEEERGLFELAERRYSAGLGDFTDVLRAKVELLGVEQQLIQTELSIVKNRIFLYRALGGVGFSAIENKLPGD